MIYKYLSSAKYQYSTRQCEFNDKINMAITQKPYKVEARNIFNFSYSLALKAIQWTILSFLPSLFFSIVFFTVTTMTSDEDTKYLIVSRQRRCSLLCLDCSFPTLLGLLLFSRMSVMWLLKAYSSIQPYHCPNTCSLPLPLISTFIILFITIIIEVFI